MVTGIRKSQDGKGTHEILAIAEELLVTNDYRRVAFLQGRGIGCPTSMCMQVALTDYFLKRGHESGKGSI